MNTNNISKSKLKGNNIGVVFGTFAPLHIGHQQLIYKSLMKNDGTLLVVSGYDNDRGDKIGLSLSKRFRYLREAFNDEPTLRVSELNENGMPEYPNGWTEWCDKLWDIMVESLEDSQQIRNISFTIYVSEPEYKEKLEQLMPANCTVELQDRSCIDISATEIRENPIKHWDKINRAYRRFFTKKILIAGSASVGKSTLVRRLARSISAPFSEEFARTYEEDANITDEELRKSDYANFLIGQLNANYKEICSPSNNGITIFDTDAIVTQTYAQLYLPENDYAELEDLINISIEKEDFDLIIVIPPVTDYVDDGFRNMDWADSRYEFHNALMANFKAAGFGDKIVIVDDKGTNKEDGFYQRYLHAMTAIEDATGIKMHHL